MVSRLPSFIFNALWVWVLALLAHQGKAQYEGGAGRGEGTIKFQHTPLVSSIFNGGSGRGEVKALYQHAPLYSTIYSGGGGRGEVTVRFDPRRVQLYAKGFLEGPYMGSTGMMSDALRNSGLLPALEPYTALGYPHVGGGGETIGVGVLNVTGNDAVVDWVVVELRIPGTPYTVIDSRSALIQRDGDVVSMDGDSPLTFNKPPGNYTVALRHRNHLGVMTASPLALTVNPTLLDLTLASTITYGIDARKSITGVQPALVLWTGDVTFNGQIRYTGSGNDRDPILSRIGGSTPTNSAGGYFSEDVNLDGTVKYTGSANDRDPILLNIGGSSPTSSRSAQLP